MLTLKIALAYAGHKLLEKNLGEGGPVLTLEESSLQANNMKKSKNSPSSKRVDFCEVTGSERRTVSIAAPCGSLVYSL